jgi:hypothetical protein
MLVKSGVFNCFPSQPHCHQPGASVLVQPALGPDLFNGVVEQPVALIVSTGVGFCCRAAALPASHALMMPVTGSTADISAA